MICGMRSPLPDELHYSLFARLYDLKQYPSKRAFIQELFGSGAVIAVVDFPSHLDHFIAALPPGNQYTAERFIKSHTLLPAYEPFLPQERVQQVQADMRGTQGPSIQMRLGVMASRISLPQRLRVCPACVEHDRTQFGECYWHRVHQMAGVEVCPIHATWLQDTNVSTRNARTRHEFVSAERAVGQLLRTCERADEMRAVHQPLLHIARDMAWLLDYEGKTSDLDVLRDRYVAALADHNLAIRNGNVRSRKLVDALKECLSPMLLALLHCKLDEGVSDNWLMRLIRTPHSAQHPLYHLLLIQFLGYTAEEFLTRAVEHHPFGSPPWPCLNQGCDNYRQNSIPSCEVVYSRNTRGQPLGTFSCKCGFVYTRTGPDTKPEDRFRRDRIVQVGLVWETKLQQVWLDSTMSLRHIARLLAVDTNTIKQHARRLGLPQPRPGGKSNAVQVDRSYIRVSSTGIQEHYRQVWIGAMRTYPEAGVTFLRRQESGAYSWLYRNDREWLREHSPHLNQVRISTSRIDWPSRDKIIAHKITASGSQLRSVPGPVKQITVAAIGRDIGERAILQRHLDKLPLCRQALAMTVESRIQFAVRRIQHVSAHIVREELPIQRWQLIKRAGVDRIAELPEVKNSIDTTLRTLNTAHAVSHDIEGEGRI